MGQVRTPTLSIPPLTLPTSTSTSTWTCAFLADAAGRREGPLLQAECRWRQGWGDGGDRERERRTEGDDGWKIGSETRVA